MSFLVITIIAVILIAGSAGTAIRLLTYKPKQVMYLSSPEALDAKHREIESIRLDALDKAYTEDDIAAANEQCDALYNLYQLRR